MTQDINYLSDVIKVKQDYGDAWWFLVAPTGDLSGRPYAAKISENHNPRNINSDAIDLEIVNHESITNAFYVGQTTATESGNFRVWATDGDSVTIVKGRLEVT